MANKKINAGSTAPTQDEISRRNDIARTAKLKEDIESGKALEDENKAKELLGKIQDVEINNNQ